jgi:DNA-binding GntR family transcriptional regulator
MPPEPRVTRGSRKTANDQRDHAAHNLIYQQLKEALMNGDFLPGQRLIVRELAERFSTSPMPVRQALHRLTSESALVEHLHRGVLVPEASIEAISDLVRVRCMIEGGAAEWAATTVTTAEIEELEKINGAMLLAARKPGGAKNYLVLNRRFHFLIYGAARSPALLATIERYWLRAGPWLNIMRQGAMIGLGLDHHAAVIEGFKTGDGVMARRAVAADITDAADIMMRAASTPSAVTTPRRKKS